MGKVSQQEILVGSIQIVACAEVTVVEVKDFMQSVNCKDYLVNYPLFFIRCQRWPAVKPIF